MNTEAHSGTNRAYSAEYYEYSNTVALIEIIMQIIMNTAAHSDSNTAANSGCNTAYCAQFHEQSSTQWPPFNSTLWQLSVQICL